MSDQFNNSDDELDAADRRIDQILKSGRTSQPNRPVEQPSPANQYESDDAIARARGRVNATRQQLGIGDASQRRQTSGAPSLTGASRSTQALILIGGLVGAGVIVVLIV